MIWCALPVAVVSRTSGSLVSRSDCCDLSLAWSSTVHWAWIRALIVCSLVVFRFRLFFFSLFFFFLPCRARHDSSDGRSKDIKDLTRGGSHPHNANQTKNTNTNQGCVSFSDDSCGRRVDSFTQPAGSGTPRFGGVVAFVKKSLNAHVQLH